MVYKDLLIVYGGEVLGQDRNVANLTGDIYVYNIEADEWNKPKLLGTPAARILSFSL